MAPRVSGHPEVRVVAVDIRLKRDMGIRTSQTCRGGTGQRWRVVCRECLEEMGGGPGVGIWVWDARFCRASWWS